MECFMDVYWGKNFWYDGTEGAPLNKIPVYETAAGAPLAWGNKNLYIPAIYVGQEGVVLDLCMRVPLSDISAFMDKWKDRDYENMSDEEVEQAESESPYSVDFNIVLALDGVRVKTTFGCSTVWNPLMMGTEPEAEALMDAYECSREYGWVFRRNCFDWEGSAVLSPEKLECVLVPEKRPVTAAHFVTDVSDGKGQERKVQLIHPLSGDTYTLTVRSCEAGQYEGDWGDIGEDLEYPSFYQAITYTVEPDISAEDLTVQDCAKGDQPRRKGAGSKEAGSSVLASSVALVPMYAVEDGEEPKVRCACSSLWFGPVDRAEWGAVFHIKKEKDFHIQAEIG